MTETQTKATQTDEAAAPTTKSIIDPKYRDKYKKRSEWMADLLKSAASVTRTIPAKDAVGKEGEDGYKPAQPERTVNEGVDVDKLFSIARENGLDVDKYEAQRSGQGFPGRFRMTVGNMLRAIAKARHGVQINGEWVEAPEDWRAQNNAPASPTHDHAGAKIGGAPVEAKKEPESKLIKKEAASNTEETPAKAETAKGKAKHKK